MRSLRAATILIILFLMFSSCSSIYVSDPEHTANASIEVDPNEEYFTLGTHHTKITNEGFVYKDYFIYVDTQEYQEPITYPNGDIGYQSKEAQRIVKINVNTGSVSSVCLNPACNHSVTSDCPMIFTSKVIVTPQGAAGDWFIFSCYHTINELHAMVPDTYAYNMITGELIGLFEYNVNESVLNTTGGILLADDKVYFVKNVLDYSNTGYQGGSNANLDKYTPETKSYLNQFDCETKELSELMEVPYGYKITARSNERFFFFCRKGDIYGEIYSCSINGGELTKEDVWNFSPQDFIGTYAYYCDAYNRRIDIYDLRTNTHKVIETPYNYAWYYVTDEGIVLSTFADDEKYAEVYDSPLKKTDFLAWDTECRKTRAESNALVYLLDFDGSNPRLIFEKEKVEIQAMDYSGKYLFGYAYYYDPENSYALIKMENDGRALINIETGEITMIPLLELILPEGYK